MALLTRALWPERCRGKERVVIPQDAALEREWHRKFAVTLFNLVWDLLDKGERTTEEDDKMLHAAHASRFHWGEIGTPLELARGEWQVARVQAVLHRPEGAIYHARRCLAICEANGIGDFDLAFAYEALARAHAVTGEAARSREYLALAAQAGEKIADKGRPEALLRRTAGCLRPGRMERMGATSSA
jgi:hypothetical protein